MTTINPPIFLRLLTASILFWAAIVFCFILLINPYGVSIINYKFRHFNALKPKRIDIDRIIKPFEVAFYKPRTVFMGTSRIHRSINPSVLDGTPFAPAYNASIPASTLSENADFLADFFGVDANLRYVFVELYIYNFIHDQSEPPGREKYWLAHNTVSLFFSADALLASLQTISANAWGRQGAEIKEQGFFSFGSGLDTAIRFSEKWFIDSTLNTHKNIPAISIRPSAVSALERIIETYKRTMPKYFS